MEGDSLGFAGFMSPIVGLENSGYCHMSTSKSDSLPRNPPLVRFLRSFGLILREGNGLLDRV